MINLLTKPFAFLAAVAITTVQSAQAPTPKIYVSTLYPVQVLRFAQSAKDVVVAQGRIAGRHTQRPMLPYSTAEPLLISAITEMSDVMGKYTNIRGFFIRK